MQFKEMRDVKMALIMDVALEHFANEGYFRTTISHIARHAGISKGLMYNYFDSKEALLKAIIHRSVNEVYNYIDIHDKSCLTEEDFVTSIRKITVLLEEKRYFWQLLMQLVVQNDVREQFVNAFPESDSLMHPGHEPGDYNYPSNIFKLFTGYFQAKKTEKGEFYDPDSDFELFITTLLGYSIKTIYMDSADNDADEKMIDRIIEQFK